MAGDWFDDNLPPGMIRPRGRGGDDSDAGTTLPPGHPPPGGTPPTPTPPTTTPPTTTEIPRWHRDYANGWWMENTGTPYEGTPEDWIRAELNSGIDPQEAIKDFNRTFHAKTGNEATWYAPDANRKWATIGLPSGYFTQEGGKHLGPGLDEWGYVQRGPEGAPPPKGGGIGGTKTPGQIGVDPAMGQFFGSLLAPFPEAPFSFPDFQAPTAVTQQNDPGFQFRMDQGRQAVERGAAAKGTLLTGGTLKDLTDYAQGRASDEYGNVYNRAFQDWATRYDKAHTGFTDRYNIYENQNTNTFNRLASLSGLGQTSALNLSNNGLNFAGLAGNAATGGGNALAAGIVGGANAYSGALSVILNDVLTAAFLNSQTRNSAFGGH